MKKILLIGEIYSENLGDGIICDCVEGLIQKNLNNVEITKLDLSGKSGYIRPKKFNIKNGIMKYKLLKKVKHKIDYILHLRRFIKIKNKLDITLKKDYDIAIFVGGQMFMDCFVFPIYYIVKTLNTKGVKVIFNACGVGKSTSRFLRKKLKKALEFDNVKNISTRDDMDKINNVYLKNSYKKAVKTYDPALWTKEIYNVNKQSTDVLGLGVMYVPEYTKDLIIKYWLKIMDELNKKNIKYTLFCNGSIRDYEICREIKQEMKKRNIEVHIEKRPERTEELVKIIAKYKSIISFRLHSHIVACSLDIPSIGIIWDQKLKFFFRSIKEERCVELVEREEIILKNLQEAEKKGIKSDLVNMQKQYSENVLITNIKEILYKDAGKK